MLVDEIATEVHDRAWEDSAVKPLGRSFLLPYLPRLQQVNNRELLVYSFSNFDLPYNTAFLLSAPEVWEPLVLDDWASIARALSPRPPIKRLDPTGCYSDTVFFLKWLGLDGLGFVVSRPDIPLSDKQLICHYCRANAPLLLPAPDDVEDMDGDVLCTADRFTAYRARLLAQDGRLQPSFSDERSFRTYADAIAASLGG